VWSRVGLNVGEPIAAQNVNSQGLRDTVERLLLKH